MLCCKSFPGSLYPRSFRPCPCSLAFPIAFPSVICAEVGVSEVVFLKGSKLVLGGIRHSENSVGGSWTGLLSTRAAELIPEVPDKELRRMVSSHLGCSRHKGRVHAGGFGWRVTHVFKHMFPLFPTLIQSCSAVLLLAAHVSFPACPVCWTSIWAGTGGWAASIWP